MNNNAKPIVMPEHYTKMSHDEMMAVEGGNREMAWGIFYSVVDPYIAYGGYPLSFASSIQTTCPDIYSQVEAVAPGLDTLSARPAITQFLISLGMSNITRLQGIYGIQ